MSHKKRAKNVTDTDLERWCSALVCGNADTVPPGWVTVAELATKLGKADCTISSQMTRAVRDGRAEMQRFRIQTGRGVYPVPHYRLLK